MDNCKTIDIEDAIQAALNAEGIKAAAPPVPANLSPCVYVYRTGGNSQNYVQDTHLVSFDCYAHTEAEAMEQADELTKWVRYIVGRDLLTPVYASELVTLPYNNPDPSHPTLPRATFLAQITTRVAH